ncbi:MAG: hypothetical protein ACYCT3_04885 [Acidiferrobacter sp.]
MSISDWIDESQKGVTALFMRASDVSREESDMTALPALSCQWPEMAATGSENRIATPLVFGMDLASMDPD